MSDVATEARPDKKRRRRRRRNNRGNNAEEGGGGGGKGRFQDEGGGQNVRPPSSGKTARRSRRRRRRAAPVAGLNRRRRLSRSELDDLKTWFTALPDPLLHALYKGMGGQPGRVTDKDRVVQLAVRAVAQGTRMSGMLKTCHPRERTALAILLQAGGLAHADELHAELTLSLGGTDREWQKVMLQLANRGLVFASEERDNQFFYLVPDPLVEHIVEQLDAELAVPTFAHEDILVRDHRPFAPPLDFSITTLCTYLDQHPARLTQQHEIFKADKTELDEFFAQVWAPDSELFNFHLDFLMLHGLAELRGDRLAVNRDVVEEWLFLDAQDQRDLVFSALGKRFGYAEWVLYAVHSAKGEWVPERPLSALYRRWTRGDDWRTRFGKGEYEATRTSERQSFSFSTLVNCGMLELGEWGQEKFYRLTERAKRLLDPPEDDGFTQFYLTPSFEIMAPAGLAPLLLFRIGEIAELNGCDRANTYKITEIVIEHALEKGWRRDDVLDFLRENSQIGLPENVESTLKGWMGHHGDVEFHDCVILTVNKTRIRKLEGSRELKPYLLHRFVPGMYAVDRNRIAEIISILEDQGFQPSKEVTPYPADADAAASRERLHHLVAEAREASDDPTARAREADVEPGDLLPVPGAAIKSGPRKPRKKKGRDTPRLTTREARKAIDQAIALNMALDLRYTGKDGSATPAKVVPERLALNPAGEPVMVALDLASNARRTYKLERIERLKATKR